jgi:hypothetical protein
MPHGIHSPWKLALAFLLFACRTDAPRVHAQGNDTFVTTGVEYVHAEMNARKFCAERGQPVMRPVDKAEQTVHVTGGPAQVQLIFRCEGGAQPLERD